ncbi:hypothetical protein [Rubritalea tangerina]
MFCFREMERISIHFMSVHEAIGVPSLMKKIHPILFIEHRER